MFHFGWLSNLLGISEPRMDRRRPAQQYRDVRLMLEQLEDRLTPTTTAFGPGVEAMLPAAQLIPAIEVQIFKQIPYLQYWNSWLDQNTGFTLPGVSEMFSTLQAQFPDFSNFAHF